MNPGEVALRSPARPSPTLVSTTMPAEPEPPVAPRTVAAIPALNEEATIGSVILLARKHVDAVLVIDDGSQDETGRISELAGAIVLRHETNGGKGRAMRTALQWCKDRNIQEVVFLDADAQHDPDEIPKVLEPVRSGVADLCIGARFGKNTEMPMWRRVGKRTLDYTTSIGTKGKVTDSQSGFRALGRKAIEALSLEEKGFGVESEMVIRAEAAGLRFAEVPITCAYGDLKGSTKGPVTQAMSVFSGIMRTVGERHPLLILGVPGVLMLIGGVVMGVYAFEVIQRTDRIGNTPLAMSVVASLMVLGGLTMGLAAVILNVLPNAIARQLRADRESFPAVRRP